MSSKNKTNYNTLNLVGVVPMAGYAKRLGDIGGSKEIYPIPLENLTSSNPPTVICEHLLQKFTLANISNVYIVLRDGKWDIPEYLGSGSKNNLHLAYLMRDLPYGTPYSIDQVYPFAKNSLLALGFPDMMLGEGDLYGILLQRFKEVGADVMLGLFPADHPEKVDMVEVTHNGEVENIVIKPKQTNLDSTWGIAIWNPRFTQFMHDFLLVHQRTAETAPELFIGDVIQAGIKQGLRVHGCQISDRPFLDIGTPEDLEKIQRFTS